MLPLIGIVYVPFKNKRHFADVVHAWSMLSYPKDRLIIYIVPNSDPEGMLPEIERVASNVEALGLPRIIILNDGQNKGFAGNHNLGMKEALKDGCDYVYLNNGDLKLSEHAINEVVAVAERDVRTASVQSLMLYWHTPDEVNASGGVFHVAGYGYARDNHTKHTDIVIPNNGEIAYASGGAVLYRTSALQKVGLLEEGFFMYHEDLELGLRFRVAGYKNVLAEKSLAYHDYTFAINQGLFQWTETYRYIVLFAYWRPATLLLLMPIILGVEIATWIFALRGKWIGPKWRATCDLWTLKSWILLFSMRMRMKRLRIVRDRDLFQFVSGTIQAQEQSNWVVERIANPCLAFYVRVLRKIIFW